MTPEQRDRFILRHFLNQLNVLWQRYPERKAVKYVSKDEFKCVRCGKSRKRPLHKFTKTGRAKDRRAAEQFQVDHMSPVGKKPKTLTWENVRAYCYRKLCFAANLQLLCVKCHKGKTNEDRKRGWT